MSTTVEATNVHNRRPLLWRAEGRLRSVTEIINRIIRHYYEKGSPMNSDITSPLLTIITSGVVSSLIIYLAKSWITERLKHAIAHEYAQKLEAHRASLKSDYDVQLERLRAENTKQLAIEASARSSLSDAYRAAHERRLVAIERAWAIILKIRSVTPTAVSLLDIMHDEEYKTVPNIPVWRSMITNSQDDRLEERLPRAYEGMDEIRPFVGDRIYTLLFVYQAIHGRIEFLLLQSLDKKHLDPWWDDTGIHQSLLLVLSENEIEELQYGQSNRLQRVQSILETKLLQEFQPIISGEASAQFSLKQAIGIQEAASAIFPKPTHEHLGT
jgi:hypothetical protein